MPAVIDEKATEQARAAIAQLLEDRPEFRDTKNSQVQDLMMFLEVEEGSEEWLPQFEDNTRALSNIWHNVIKEGVKPLTPKEEVAIPAPVQPKTNGNGTAPRKPAALKAEAPKPKKEETPKPKPETKPENRREEKPAPVVTPEAVTVEAEVIEPVHYDLVLRSGPPQVMEERALQTSRALAEQFSIVQYYEQMIEQANQTVEELNEALARAKQGQANAAQAYANALEDLARLMATSLGPKASDFSKLLARVVGGQAGKK
jgi:outer membrane biosynthesis protein TonB